MALQLQKLLFLSGNLIFIGSILTIPYEIYRWLKTAKLDFLNIGWLFSIDQASTQYLGLNILLNLFLSAPLFISGSVISLIVIYIAHKVTED